MRTGLRNLPLVRKATGKTSSPVIDSTTIQMNENQEIQISIVSACRNEVFHITSFLQSIEQQDLDGFTWEVIIADGLSTDGTRELLDQYSAAHPNVIVIPNPGRIVSTGLNKAIRAARGEIVLRLDAHTHYAPDYVRRCVETLRHTGADNVGGPARTRATCPVQQAIAAAYHSRFSTGGARFHNPGYEGWVDTVTYGCWRKETLERLGLFDENLVRNQDDELNLRLVRAGGKIWQNPEIISWYSPRSTVFGLFQQYFQYGYWKVVVIRKHRLPGSWRHVVPAAFVGTNLLLPFLTALFFAIGATVNFDRLEMSWLALTVCYAAANLMASILAARRSGWTTLLWLPPIFAAYHFSYGFGFLMGLFHSVAKPQETYSQESVLVRITR